MKKIILFLTIGLGLLVFYCGKDDTNPDPDPNTFTDTRDGQNYCWVTLKDGNKWMAENLNYETAGSTCYNNKESRCKDYGRLYTWDAALTACPEGWRLPSNNEWQIMIEEYGGLYSREAYNALIDGGSSGFDAQLGGSFFYYGLDNYGCYWSSTEDGVDFAKKYSFRQPTRKLARGRGYKGNYYSCRCVQD